MIYIYDCDLNASFNNNEIFSYTDDEEDFMIAQVLYEKLGMDWIMS